MKLAAGVIMYRMRNGAPEILLVHPGGPQNVNNDLGWWSIPKGLADNGEEGDALLDVAKREFEEETGFKPEGQLVYVGSVLNGARDKTVHAWMMEGDADVLKLKSNTCMFEWPPRSGKQIEIPEVDRGEFFDLETAKNKIHDYQLGLIEQFERKLGV